MVEPTNHPARDEWERMLSGELYVADSPQQQEANMRKRRLVQAINTSEYDAFKERDELFHELFGAFGEVDSWNPHSTAIMDATRSSARISMQHGLHFP